MDILAIKISGKNIIKRHYEVTVSTNPVSYLARATKKMQGEGWKANSAKTRTPTLMRKCVQEWVVKKFTSPEIVEQLTALVPGKWENYLVVNKIRHIEEITYVKEEGINVIEFPVIVNELRENKYNYTASRNSLIELMLLD